MPKTPFLLIPGLNADDRVFAHAIPALWPFGPVTVANHLDGEGVAGMARTILAGRLRRVRNSAAGSRSHCEAGADRHVGTSGHSRI
jgi:hypothetical protein